MNNKTVQRGMLQIKKFDADRNAKVVIGGANVAQSATSNDLLMKVVELCKDIKPAKGTGVAIINGPDVEVTCEVKESVSVDKTGAEKTTRTIIDIDVNSLKKWERPAMATTLALFA